MVSVLPQLERAATLAYTSADNEERKRNAELLSGFHTNKDCIPQCFAEADTRILTDCGLLFLDQLEQRLQRGNRPVLFACYDTGSGSIQYRPGRLLLRQPGSRLLSFTAPAEARRWAEDSSPHSPEPDSEDGSGVSLRVTPDHRMFVQLSGEEQPTVRPAASLLPSCSCRPAQLCSHPHGSLRFVACAESGHAEVQETASRSRVQRSLALADAQFPLFLELLGFWTAIGSLSHHSTGSDCNAVRFPHLQPHDQQWLAGLLPQCGLAHDDDWQLHDGDLSITAPHWFDCFASVLSDDSAEENDDDTAVFSSSPSTSPCISHGRISTSQHDSTDEAEQQLPQPDSSESVNCLPSWVLMQLEPQELLRVINGLRRASCRHRTDDKDVIFTSSARLRDQLMQALLHCGFSPLARQHHSACWAVSWATPGTASGAASCWPSLEPRSDISSESYDAAADGRIWCVTVEHSDHLIIAQRASRQCGAVLRQSRPVIVGQCRLILDQSENQYALLLAASSLLKLVTLHYHTMTLQHTIDINNYLLNFLAQKCTALPSFVLTPLIQTLTRIVKLGWRLDARFADVLSDVAKFLQATPRHHRVGLLIMSELIAEMNDNRTGESQVEHRRTARGFRDQTLLTVWTLSMQSIRQVAQQPGIAADSELDELMGAALALSNASLTFDFIGSLMDDSLDELAQMSLQIPAAWRPVMEDSTTPQLYFDIIAVVRSARQAQAMEVLGGLATVRRSIFSTEEKRMAFLLVMARGVQTVLASQSSILADAAVFHQFCITLARLKTNYPLPELSKLEIYDSLIGLIANFTLSAFKSSSSPNSLHYLLLVWSRVVGDLPYLKVACLSMQHQLLTDTGFMGWDDITQRLRLEKQQLHCEKGGSRRLRIPTACEPLLVATYDAERRQLQYRAVDSLVLNHGQQEMITAADDKSNIHFSVTEDHQMLVALASSSSSSFSTASSPLADAQLSLLPARRLLDPSPSAWTFRCSAENGVDHPPADLSAIFPDCDIDSPAQQQRALELAGEWLLSNACDDTTQSCSQSLPDWVWTLSAEQTRWLVNGLRAASGSTAVIRTSNSTMREEMLHLCLNAGYTAVAADDGSIEYSSDAAVSCPIVSSACIRRELSEEQTWCVSVPPHHLLLTRLTPSSRPVWMGNCFPESDTRILTNWGLLFLDQIEWLRRQRYEVLFGCYDLQSKTLRYSKGKVVLKHPPKRLVAFTSDGEAARWAEGSSDYGTEGGPEGNPSSRHVSLRVTPDHDMFVQLGRRSGHGVSWSSTRGGCDPASGKEPPAVLEPHRKVRAQHLLSTDARDYVRLLACAEAGYAPQATSRRRAVQRDLHLDDTQFAAFLELLGFWLGDGSLDDGQVAGSARGYVTFSQVKQTDLAWLRSAFEAAGLKEDEHWLSSSGIETILFIREPAWFAFFDKEFGRKSVKHLPAWTLQELPAAEMRLLISGLHRADGSCAAGENVFCTSSARFRDELMQALLHCGYSAHAGLKCRKGAIRGYKFHDQTSDTKTYSVSFFAALSAEEQLNYRPIVATAVAWKVSWAVLDHAHTHPAAGSCWPSMSRQKCVKRVPYNAQRDGRIWCVEVEHKDHLIIAQRAERHGGVVTKQSRPIVVANCSPFLEDFLPSISTVFIQSRLDAIVAAQREDTMDELFEEPALSDQLKSLPALLKYNYGRSKEWLKSCVDKVMQDYTKSATVNGGGSAAVRVSEGQLAMLIYIWAAIIGWEKDSPQQDKEASESYDAELCAWYFQSMPMVEYRLSSSSSATVFPQLALASLYFLQEFRKRFMQQVTKTSAESKEADMMNEMMSPSASSAADGVNISFTSPPSPSSLASIAPLTTVVYPLVPAYLPFSFSPLLPLLSSHSYDIDLGSYTTTSRGSSFFSKLNAAYKALASSAQQQQQLKAHITQTSIIANMLSTCLLFLNRFAGDESVVAACLELLENLSLGYASSQLLSSSEPIKQILSAHRFDAFPFLARAGSQRAKLHTAFYLIIGRVLFKSGNVDNFDSFMLPFEQGFAALQSMNHLRSEASAQASVALCRKLQGLLEASASYSTYLLLWEWLHPAYLPMILRICETFADNAVVSSSVLQLFGELAYNRSQRIRFDSNSPYGIVLFRETSRLLTIYMHRLLAAKPDANSEQYKQKIKGVSLCLTTLTRALSGGYANFGIMALYEDHALSSTFNLMLQLIISLHLSDLLSYPALAEPYFAFLEVSYKQHMSIMVELEQKVFWALVSSLHEGLQSFSVVCSTHCAAAIDFLFSYVVTEGRRKRRAANYQRLLKHMASSGGLVLELFTTLMNLYLFEQIPNAYSLSRPIFTLVVYSADVWSQYQQRLMAVQGGAEAAERVRRVMTECMQGVQLTLEHEAKDKFFSHLTVLKNELAAFAVRLN